MKHRLLIVEDEKVERESTLLMLQLHVSDVVTVETAENGIEALRLFAQNVPDVVIMDIDLPGFSGIETISRMREISVHTQYIILTAYQMFAYAQAALKLGVLEYLLKPCSTNDLLKAVDVALGRVTSGKSSQQTPDDMSKRLEEIRPVLESDCIYAIASMHNSAPLQELFQFLQLQPGEGVVFAVKSSIAQRKLLTVVKRGLLRMELECIGAAINGLCIFVLLGSAANGEEKLHYIAEYLSGILQEAQFPCHIGIGKGSQNVEQLCRSYNQSLKALTHALLRNLPFAVYTEDMREEKQEEISVKETARTLLLYIKNQNHKGIADVLTEVFAQWPLRGCPRSQIDTAVYRLWLIVVGAMPEVITDELLEEITLQKIRYYPELSTLCQKMIQVLTKLSTLTLSEERQNNQSNELITRALEIIHEHYADSTSLNQVAAELNITPFYLSKLVKKQTGKTFTDYLVQCRIGHAQELLLDNKLSIKEVTYAVGFNSQNYFAKIFKKYTQLSPSDYRASAKSAPVRSVDLK